MTMTASPGYEPMTGEASVTASRMPGIPTCRVCDASVQIFLDQGMQPIANGFRDPADTSPEPRYSIQYAFCPSCYLVQIVEQPPAEAMFNANYAFLTGSSQGMVDYYETLAQTLRERHEPNTVLEIGCNDGTFLENLADLQHLGIDPSANVAMIAAGKGLAVHIAPWGVLTARRVMKAWKYGASIDLVCAFHCITHISDLNDFLAGVRLVLAPNGVLVLEDPSLDAIVKAGDFAQFYDEHATVLSLPAMSSALARHGMEIINAEPVATHGGSMRVTAARVGMHPVAPEVRRLIDGENHLTNAETFRQFARRADATLDQLGTLLTSLRQQGKMIAGYGASSKLTLALNRLGVSPLNYVTDSTATKIGRRMPGTGDLIIGRDDVSDVAPAGAKLTWSPSDYFLCGAYVHLPEVLKKERAFLERGGRFIVWTPEVKTVGLESL